MATGQELQALEEIEQRVLWLAVRMVDYANRERPNRDGLKVGGHQASSASMVSLMTALWFSFLRKGDRVSVKPHASPVFHAIQYLMGLLEQGQLKTLRSFGGLQAYPSRTKDPDQVDFSTGSVGLGAVAPLFAAATRRYVDSHFGPRPASRFIALMGDAELDEGNVWEAIADPATAGLGNVLWVVDLNRQSLDRVIPGIKAARLERIFADNGWHVVEAKYGRRMRAQFEAPSGEALRRFIDDMANEEYQSLFRYTGSALRERFLSNADAAVKEAIADVGDHELASVLQNLGGHDLAELLSAFTACDSVTDKPSVVFAYTVKGWGLPMAGDPANHSALLTEAQITELRSAVGLTSETEWDRFPDGTDASHLIARARAELQTQTNPNRRSVPVPLAVGIGTTIKPVSTQEAFGRALVGLAREAETRTHIVTTSPDVSITTNLGGWINRVGVFAPDEEPDWFGDDRALKWHQSPAGQHIELGISEMNLFMMLSQLGLAHDLSDQTLLPIGVVYDPFVCRGLDALIYAAYSGARFIVVGTPSGVTLSPEGGAHQSTITASIGVELPGLTLCEPAYAAALDWLLCDGLSRLANLDASPESLYLRLTTRAIDQAPMAKALERLGVDELRRQVVMGGYRLVDATVGRKFDRPVVQLCASGAVMPEVLVAADELADEGVAANVIDITSLDRLHRAWRSSVRAGVRTATPHMKTMHHFSHLFPFRERRAPIVTVHDASSHAMSWLGSVFGAPVVPLGVDGFGQSGRISDLYEAHDLSSAAIVNAALVALATVAP